jgi:hypothetical protein
MQPIDISRIPAELISMRRWIAWKLERRGQKSTKLPVGSRTNDPKSWLSIDDACAKAAAVNGGIGFVLGDGLVGIDFDQCIDENSELHPAVAQAVTELGSYAESSPSGRGVHILVRGAIAQSRKMRAISTLPAREIYERSRYFTVTGNRLTDVTTIASGEATQAALDRIMERLFTASTPTIVGESELAEQLTDDVILELLRAAKNRAKAERLLRGDATGYGSASEADFGLCGILRFYTRDPAQIDRLFRASGLMRKKWDERHGQQTYGALTIDRALAKGGKVYHPPKPGAAADRAIRERESYASRLPLWWAIRMQGAGELAFRVLWVICSYANEKGEAWPTIATIAAHCRVTERSVFRALATLREGGVLQSGPHPEYDCLLYRLSKGVPEVVMPLLKEKRAPGSSRDDGSGCKGDDGTCQGKRTIEGNQRNYTGEGTARRCAQRAAAGQIRAL